MDKVASIPKVVRPGSGSRKFTLPQTSVGANGLWEGGYIPIDFCGSGSAVLGSPHSNHG